MQFSFWEKEYLLSNDSIVIIGAGIVGLSTAISLKEKYAHKSVIVIDRYFMPQGASTKNAGFVCFGSVTEILDDLDHMTEREVCDIISMRWQGIKILEKRLREQGVSIDYNQGKELYEKGRVPSEDQILICNKLMYDVTGRDPYFKTETQQVGDHFDPICTVMDSEGQLDAVKMYQALWHMANGMGVKWIFGYEVTHVAFDKKEISLNNQINLTYDKVVFCTNGFARKLLPHLEVAPARNQVCVTEPIDDLQWSGVYHFDKGYYYFRRVGDRILLGGARNFDAQKEATSSFEFNEKIQEQLTSFLHNMLGISKAVKIDHWWTGILGIGKSKYPIVEAITQDVFVGVRLGGMGVAIGSYLGELLANKLKL
jgi:gamma-glutamylputrescine oxidase